MTRTVRHKTEGLEMRDHVDSVPEEVCSRDSEEIPSPLIPTKRTIRRQGGGIEASDGQGNHNEYVDQ